MRFAIVSRTSATAVSLIFVLGCSSALRAQRTQAPTLKQILERLQANLNHYDAAVPSLICDEHVISSQTEPGTRGEKTTVDSVFRLKRTPNADHTSTLVESREIKTVDGRPPASQDIDAPTLLSGLFEGGLAVVSLNQAVCMNYALQSIHANRPADAYIVRFATALTRWNTAGCFLQEKSKGRVFIDPASMQITHLEIITPRHTITDPNSFTSRVVGRRELNVDYAPVLLGGKTFWMPTAVTMRTSSSGFRLIVWSFHAVYRNYHRLEVTSRILPDKEDHAP